MQPDQWDKLKSIWSRIVDLPRDQRSVYLDEACGGDLDVKFEIESLLAASEKLDTAVSQSGSIEQPLGTMIGPYKLLELIGEGGFGLVYLAEQQHPVVRKVALKIIKLGMDTRAVIARFEAERQALAMMDHPNIARVFDAGATETGRPYFVMELVKGIPITEYCDQNNLTVRQRLELLIPICQAVQHAHQKGIIHRDIKPSNVLVCLHDGKPVPKVIDFGIAKAINQRLTEKTLFTEFKQMIGTPAYMSPEQAEFSDLNVDTRSDIYSLGVLMYELLTGVTPFDERTLRSAAYAEMQRIIREVEPPRPSTRLSTLDTLPSVAACRGIEPAKLTRSVRGELDWIVMRCLEKDRTRRYATAEGLGADITRYLSDQPVTAGPTSRWYRVQKVIRRHRAGVAASAGMILLLIGGIVATTWQAIRATRAEHQAQSNAARADSEAANAKAVVEFLTQDVIGSADPAVNPGRKVTVEEALTRAGQTVADRFKDRPLVEAAVRDALRKTFKAIGRADLALPNAKATLERRRRVLGDGHPDTIASLHEYASTLESLGRSAEAEPLHRQALEQCERLLSQDHPLPPEVMLSYATTLNSLGRSTDAVLLVKKALEQRRRVLGEDHPDTIESLHSYAFVLSSQGRRLEAEPLYKKALEQRRRVLGDDHPSTINSLSSYAILLESLGRAAEAEPLFKQVLEQRRRVQGEDHRLTARSLYNYAFVLKSLGRAREAEPLFRQSLEQCHRILGEDHPETISRLKNLGSFLSKLGRHSEAEALLREALERSRRALGEDHPQTISSLNLYGEVLQDQGRHAEAEPLYREALERSRQVLGEDHPDTIVSLNDYASVLAYLGRSAQAELLFKQVLEKRRRMLGEDHPDTLISLNNYGFALGQLGRTTEAEPLYRQVLEKCRRVRGDNHPLTLSVMSNYAWVLESLGRASEAEPLSKEALERRQRVLGAEHPQTVRSLEGYASVLRSLGRAAEAEPLLRELLQLREKNLPPGHWQRASAASVLGDVLRAQGKFDEAQQLLLPGSQSLRDNSDAPPIQSRLSIERLVKLYEDWKKPDEAANWRALLEDFDRQHPPASQPSTQPTTAPS